MSDDITKPHFVRVNDEPQQIVKTGNISPAKYVMANGYQPFR